MSIPARDGVQVVDDTTGWPASKTRESCAQGVANLVTGLFGAWAGAR